MKTDMMTNMVADKKADMAIRSQNAGFTLIEMIAGLLLLTIIGVFGSMLLVNIVKSYQWAQDNAHLTQKAQVALTRIAVEMSYAEEDTVDVDDNDNATTIVYDATYPDGSETFGNRIEKVGNALFLTVTGTDYALTDRVSEFILSEDNGYFTVELTMTGANNAPKKFEKSIALP